MRRGMVQLVNVLKGILTFFDSSDTKTVKPLIAQNCGENSKKICIGPKNVVILHPQSGNDGAQQ